jgi:tetratricopeptide (TPR) repeat protein/tRNA A-37 threonylcarbamoyl transferase component Bud32/TolB-like protein
MTDQPTIPSKPSGSEKPAARAPGLAEGDVLANRFRIVRFIARGGMGEVYEAEDQVLRERVALKTIRPDVANDPRTMERFLREVHLARSVTHPNVARTFDVFHHESLAFLTMELLTGHTLAERLSKDGRMRPDEALPLIEQMTAALTAAHEAGVVHRDFKSANVMLEPDERRPGGVRVVVTDFGLARREKPKAGGTVHAAPLTQTEAVIGTPDYMAPEQIEGRAITPATDVYALGVVIYEMVTGEQPFEGDTPLSVALKKLKEAAPSPRRHVPDLAPTWEKTILRCLERAPEDRFAAAGEVARALRGEEVSAGPATIRRRRKTIAAAVAAVLLSAGAVWVVTRFVRTGAPVSARPTAAAPRRAVAVLGFKNLAGKPEEAWVSTALAEMLTTELAAGEKLRAIPSEDVARLKNDLGISEADTLGKETLARVKRNTGADLVLLGSYLAIGPAEGGPIRLDLRLQDTTAGETIAVVSEKGSAADFDALATRAGAQLREKLDLPAVSGAEAVAVKAALPSNREAARLYAEGLARLRVYDEVSAKDLLEQAVAAEPDHALAHSALAAAWSGLGYDVKALEEAKKAFELSSDLSRETRLLIEGRYRAMNNEWAKAVDIYGSLYTFFPDNVDYGLQLARAQTRSGKPMDALATISALEKAFPADAARVSLAEAETARSISEFTRAEKAAIRAATLAEADGARLLAATARLNQGIARRNLGDPKGALAIYEQAKRLFADVKDPSGLASTINGMGNCKYDLGDLAGARQSYEEVLRIYREVGNKRGEAGALGNIANVVGDQGDLAGGVRMAEQSLALFREIGDRAGEAEQLNNIGAALVMMGDIRGSRALFEKVVPIHEELGDTGALAIALTNVGELEMTASNTASAEKSFARALQIFRDSGQKSKAVYPLVGLAGVKFETGDLSASGEMLGEALKISREVDDRHEEAFALTGQGTVALAEDRIADSRHAFEEARQIRTTIGEAGAAEQSRTDLARVALAEEDFAAAQALAAAASAELEKQRIHDDQVAALAVLARALAAGGKRGEAEAALGKARALAAKSQNEAARREVLLASATVRAAQGDAAGAAKTLREGAARAREKNLVAWALEARLLEGRILAASGAKQAASEVLAGVEKDAAARGFRRIARKAAEVRGT